MGFKWIRTPQLIRKASHNFNTNSLRHNTTLFPGTVSVITPPSSSSSSSFCFWTLCSQCRSFSSSARLFNMSSLYVKNCREDERLQINLDLQVGELVKSFNLNRMKTEAVGLALERLRASLDKKIKGKRKKTKRKKNESQNDPQADVDTEEVACSNSLPLEILHNGEVIPLSFSNECAWTSDAVLRIGDQVIPVIYNPPSIKLDNLCSTIMAGYPLFPEVEFEFCDADSCEFHWKSVEKKQVDMIRKQITNGIFNCDGSFIDKAFTPMINDIDKHILLMCIPRSEDKSKIGKTQAVISQSPVVAGPGLCPFERRQEEPLQWAKQNEFRVVSYNILAEVYTNTELAKSQLFAHCPDYAMEMSYRKQLLLKEISSYKSDVVCLQEVDRSVFFKHLTPGLENLGYIGYFRPKKGGVSEGCATFLRTDKFRVVNQLDIVLSEYLATDDSCRDIWDKICQVEALKEKVEQRSSILQVTIVESLEKPGHYLCVANTHLYFHPHADNIRLIHAATALRYLQAISNAYEAENKPLGLVFCGDFNSSPDVGVYQLMVSQFIPNDRVDWSSAGKEEKIEDLELSHLMEIVSACGTPDFTHYGSPIQCTLDYIFVETSLLDVVSSLPMFELKDLQAYTYLPNPVIPSDHLALVADLKFKSL